MSAYSERLGRLSSLFLIIKRGLRLNFDEGLRRVFAGVIPVVTFLVLVAEKLTKSCDYGQ